MPFKNVLLTLVLTYAVFSCVNKIEPANTKTSYSSSEAQAAIAESDNNASMEVGLINNTDAMAGLTSLQSLDINTTLTPNPAKNNFGSRLSGQTAETDRKNLYNSLSKFILKTIAVGKNTNRLATDFTALKGIYNYNWDTYRFDPAGSSENIVFNFPDLENRSAKTRVNNCTYTISTIETTAIPMSETQIDTFLTKLTATLAVNGSKVLDLNYSSTYNTNGVLTSISEDATFSPYHIVYSFSTGNTLLITETISKNDIAFIEASATKTLSSDTVFGVDKYTFYYRFSDLLFSGSLDFKGLRANLANNNTGVTIFNVTDSVLINKYYKTSLKQSSATQIKIGNIVFKPETAQVCNDNNICAYKLRMIPYVIYTDSTSEKLENRLTLLKKYWKL